MCESNFCNGALRLESAQEFLVALEKEGKIIPDFPTYQQKLIDTLNTQWRHWQTSKIIIPLTTRQSKRKDFKTKPKSS